MIPQKFYVIVIVTPHPIAMESTNNYSYKSCQSSPHTLFTVMFMRSVFSIYGCYIQFQFMLLTVLGYFQEIYENHPSGNTPLFENVPPRSFKILK